MSTPALRAKLTALPDPFDFRDQLFVPTLTQVPPEITLRDYAKRFANASLKSEADLGKLDLILDQGSEGACTGFGLAAIINFLHYQQGQHAKCPVSPWMLYDLARRYDEWPGEKYDGSSARGAMKAWHKHGVCDSKLFTKSGKPVSPKVLQDAIRRPLGAYYRVNHKDLVSMHTAIAEVGALYVTSSVHEGWAKVQEGDTLIVPSEKQIGGHAFAIVGYDEEGFWIQNSWGPKWGHHGFAKLTYDDWLENAMDAWVARLGVPVKLERNRSITIGASAAAKKSNAYVYSDLRRHVINIGNDGKLEPGSNWGSSTEDVENLFASIPKTHDVMLYAHGGLVGQDAAIARIAAYRDQMWPKKIYPVGLIWNTDYGSTLRNVLNDLVRRSRPEGFFGDALDFVMDRFDDFLEPLARKLTGKLVWDEMKENARLSTEGTDGAMRLIANKLRERQAASPHRKLHLVGHSAGCILLGHFVSALAARKVRTDSCTLWAPACTVDHFRKHYQPALASGSIDRARIYTLSDKSEQDDSCAGIYNKSLLYLVSNAFEARPAIRGVRPGVALLGMEKFIYDAIQSTKVRHIVAGETPDSNSRSHGGFDEDAPTVRSTFSFMLNASTPSGISAGGALPSLGSHEFKVAPVRAELAARRKRISEV